MTDLNPEQQIAVHHVEGPMLVLAGAGSGKTRVVTARIAHLLEMGIPSSEIIALTFTNRAAKEMKLRVERLCRQTVLTSTFHSLGARILRESISHLGLSPQFAIYDEDDSLELLKNCLALLDQKEEKGLAKSLRIAISNIKNSLLPLNEFPEDYRFPRNLLQKLFLLYEQKLKEYNALDFDDLLYLTVNLLESSKEILAIYQKRWSFLLIDEYQDTNRAQYRLVKLLSEKHRNIFAVGDPDQSIYSWRGANIQNILDFEKDYSGATLLSLEQNYRSTTNILEGANALIQQNEKRYEKKLWSDKGTGEKIGVYIAPNEKGEVAFVVEELLKRTQEERVPLNECVIFYRTHPQSRVFEDLLLRLKIPYMIYGGVSFYQRKEIKDLLAYLRMTISDVDFLSFARTINLPKRGIGAQAIEKLRMISEEQTLPILSLCRKAIDGEIETLKLSKKQREGITEYLLLIQTLREKVKQQKSIVELIEELIKSTRYIEVLKEDPETFEDRKGNIDELINKAAEWSEEREHPNLTQFLEELTLTSSVEESSLSSGAIKLMTLHNGKGLEFTLTFIVGMEEDLFPHINAKDSPEALEEERRLCYVGMTRAKEFLYLTASTYRFLWGTPKVMAPSRFLQEIPRQYVRDLSPTSFQENPVEWEEGSFTVGSLVFHRDFGKGVIQKVYHTSFGLTYDVHFTNMEATRSLVGKYAKLSILSLPESCTDSH